MTDTKVLKINSVTFNSVTVLNVTDLQYRLVQKDTVRFTPNTTAGIGVRNFPKHHRITIVFDSRPTALDSYIDDDGINTAIPTFSCSLKVLRGGTEQTETWTFEASKSRVFRNGELRVDRYQERRPWEVVIIVYGTRTRTWA